MDFTLQTTGAKAWAALRRFCELFLHVMEGPTVWASCLHTTYEVGLWLSWRCLIVQRPER